jgi:hypothetical protein
MEKVKIYSIYTDELKEIKDIFLESIKDDWDINMEYWGKSGEGDGDFATNGWYNIQRRKIKFLIEKIKENWGNIIIWSDVDIQFFAKCDDLIKIAIDGKDIVFQAEWWPQKEVNVGFSVIRCNHKTLLLYQSVLQSDIENLPIADQSAMNNILKEKKVDVEWDILPNQFWATSHYMFDLSSPPVDVVLHHANCTAPTVRDGEKIGSVELKLEQFEIIRRHVLQEEKESK